ncbi:MAG: hypothetical protein MJ182_09975 [Treponema sp.]|nr:hypothetical protein [Treponema sp.]
MIPRIKSIVDRSDYKLEVLFDDGKRVLYDVAEDIKQIPDFMDLASDSIYEYGKVI